MGRSRSRAEMIADVRSRTNLETSEFVTDDEIGEFLNQELAELWQHICQNQGQPLYRASTAISVLSGVELYPLPADFLQVQGVEANIDGCFVTLRPFMPRERAALKERARYPYSSVIAYRVQGDNIEFLPATREFEATLFYTPSCPRLEDDSDTFDGFNGWEVAAIYGACASVQAKEETDPSFYEGRKQAIYRQIDAAATARDASEPERVQDVRDTEWRGDDEMFRRYW